MCKEKQHLLQLAQCAAWHNVINVMYRYILAKGVTMIITSRRLGGVASFEST